MNPRRPNVVKFGKTNRELSAPMVLVTAIAIGIGLAFLWAVVEAKIGPTLAQEPTTHLSHGSKDQSDPTNMPRAFAHSDQAQPNLKLCGDGRRFNCVVDGDTLWLRGNKIRVADIDTPEIDSPQCDYEYDLGMHATDRFRQLLNEGPFSVERISDHDTDQFGRQLRVITRKGKSIGGMLVNEGLARTWAGRREPWC
jgi:endonuclease YncB( thermonuclease family)